MSTQIDTNLVQAYQNSLDVKFQQMGSRLRGAVRVETQNAEYEFYDRVTSTAAVEVTTRHGDTPLIETPHERRRVGLRHYDWADLIDNKDKIQMLADPTGPYVTNAAAALNRAIDDVIIDAFTATASAGKTGAAADDVSFPAASEIAVDYVESGAAADSNMTIGKLRRSLKLLEDEEAADDEKFVAWGPSQKQALLRTTEVTSSDYNTVKALVNGEINTFMGFQFILSNRLDVDANNVRDCFAFTRQGMLLAMGKDITVDVGPRRDKRNSMQVYVCGSFGAVRLYEEKVLRIKCDEDL